MATVEGFKSVHNVDIHIVWRTKDMIFKYKTIRINSFKYCLERQGIKEVKGCSVAVYGRRQGMTLHLTLSRRRFSDDSSFICSLYYNAMTCICSSSKLKQCQQLSSQLRCCRFLTLLSYPRAAGLAACGNSPFLRCPLNLNFGRHQPPLLARQQPGSFWCRSTAPLLSSPLLSSRLLSSPLCSIPLHSSPLHSVQLMPSLP